MSDFEKKQVSESGKHLFPRVAKEEQGNVAPEDIKPAQLPVGRISVDDTITLAGMLSDINNEFNTTSSKFPLSYLDALSNLSLVNPDVSQAVDNIIQLGNTGHKVVIETPSDTLREQITKEVNNFVKYAFRRYGGVDGFVNTLLGQAARTGAMSVEWVVNNKIDGIDNVVFVPTSTIRFLYSAESTEQEPWQRVSDIGTSKNGLVKLNPYTYQYFGITLLDNSPYAIPPILAALEAILIQRDVMKNFRFVAKKMGLLGFVTFLMKAPARQGGESDSAYLSRCQSFLETQADAIKNNYRDGLALGFKDNFEVEHHSLMGSAQGAAEILKEVELQVFSGLKADPAMHGRSYSTTETYAGVVYEKMLSMLTNYQRALRSILEYGFALHLTLRGYKYDSLYVEFEPSKSLSSERDEATYGQKLENLKHLYDEGIISQEQRAQEAGYDSPELPEPRSALDVPDGNADDTPPENQSSNAVLIFNRASGRYSLKSSKMAPKEFQRKDVARACLEEEDVTSGEFDALWPEFMQHYHSECGPDCQHAHHSSEQFADNSKAGKELKKFMRKYFNAVYGTVKGVREASVASLDELFSRINPDVMDSAEFADLVIDKLETEFAVNLDNSALANEIRVQIDLAFKHFRLEDAALFGGTYPIEPSFTLVDRSAIKFMRHCDEFYFGKFVSDPKTKESLKKWLADDWLKSGRSLRDRGEFAKFRARFGDRVAREDYKVLRVVETSTTRAKNWGNILSADQAGAKEVKIAGPIDNVSCDWCEAMVGQTFKVAPVVNHVKSVMARDPEDLPQLSPFLPGRIRPEILEETSEEQLIAQGIALPPYHPHCRHRFVVSSI